MILLLQKLATLFPSLLDVLFHNRNHKTDDTGKYKDNLHFSYFHSLIFFLQTLSFLRMDLERIRKLTYFNIHQVRSYRKLEEKSAKSQLIEQRKQNNSKNAQLNIEVLNFLIDGELPVVDKVGLASIYELARQILPHLQIKRALNLLKYMKPCSDILFVNGRPSLNYYLVNKIR